MKKFLAILVVLALTVFASVAMAEVTVGGAIDTRGRYLDNVDADLDTANDDARDSNFTQTRVRIDVNAKNADNTARGKVQIENDWDTWGRLERPMGASNAISSTATPPAASDAGRLRLREAWVDFNLPGLPGHLKGGHQLLQLGHGWFFRDMKFGSDAWLLGFPGKNTLAFVNVKVSEGTPRFSDDVDAYVILDVYKINDANTVGIDVTNVHNRTGGSDNGSDLYNVGLNYTGKLGPVNLKAEADFQFGTDKTGAADVDFEGKQVVVQASIPMDALTINATVAWGSGDDPTTADANEGIVTILDADPHYAFLYEYFVNTAVGRINSGFENTLALGLGASFAATKTLTVGADVWAFQANEDVALNGGTPDSNLGMEIDGKINWKITENLNFAWNLGYFMPGDAYKVGTQDADAVKASQWVLGYKF
jgi:predicted porin